MKKQTLSCVLCAAVCACAGPALAAEPADVQQVRPIDPARQIQAAEIQQAQPAGPAPAQRLQQRPANLNRADRFDQNVQNVVGGRVPGAGVHEPFEGPVTAARIQQAIDDAVLFLKSIQAADGSLDEPLVHYSTGAGTVMATLAMLAAGADPVSDEAAQRALRWLQTTGEQNTYYRAVRANVWEYALRKAPYEEYMRTALKDDFDWLMKALAQKEGWRYQMMSSDWDNSVTQYGVLGVWAAARADIAPPEDFWPRMSQHFRACQNDDGGWGYQRGGSSANMATAGLATLFLVFDKYHGRTFYSADKPSPFATGAPADCLQSIDRGMAWLGKAGGNNQDGYYLYGMERTGVASGRKYIGGRDWFAEGAEIVLRSQQRNGSIPMSGYGKTIVNTAFCTLFLVYGGAPVALNKLEYGKQQEWNLNPRDLANLTKYLWLAYEKPLNWHSVSIDSPVEEFEAPILFVSGNREVEFTDAEVAKLRAYIERGGLVLAEPSDRSKAFRASMEKLVARMYPPDQFPSRGLAPLEADHGIYTVLQQTWTRRPRLLGASDGARTFFLLSDEYLSADWQMDRTESDAFKLAMNLLFYATDLGELKGKFASVLPDSPPAKPRDAVVRVAAAKFAGTPSNPRDWEAGAGWWNRFSPYVKHVTGATLDERPAVALGRDNPTNTVLLCLAGREAIELNPAEKDALKRFADRGGTILVNAGAGAPAFAQSARKLLTELFGKPEPLSDDHDLAAGRFLGGADLSRHVRLTLPARRALRQRNQTERGQKLEICMVNRRPAVIFSEFDLMAPAAGVANFGASAYKPESARKILGNIIAYACAD